MEKLQDPRGASRFSAGERKNWAKIRDWLPKIDVLMLREVSRASRKMAEFAAFLDECRTHEVRIYHMARDRFYNPADKYDYDALIDEAKRAVFEAHQISDRVRPEMQKVWARGQAVGRTTYGYQRRYSDEGGTRS
jgi:DNA invertase Pin-like site-specific DNA recombinase